jgi:CheY-like chemotaxis protein
MGRTLLCVEPDERAVAQIRTVLAPYGISVLSIPNGEAAVDWARTNEPTMIIVSVEPRKVGYAVCNKLKRSTELAHIPLILTSAEETPQTFEQHKKLKSRADDYLLKPFRDDDFLSKVAGLIELRLTLAGRSGNGANPEHALMGAEVSEELPVGDSDIMEEDVTNDIRRPPLAAFGAQRTVAQRSVMDPAFERETDAAFAALEASGDQTGPLSIPEAATVSMWEEEKTRASSMGGESELPEIDVEESGSPFASLFRSRADEAIPYPPGPDEVKLTPAPALAVYPDSRGHDMATRLDALESERKSLQMEVETLRRQIDGSALPLFKEREYLALREVINRKEKDLLDLRDAVDAKDRQLLDQKDRFRELERARRDLEEKMLDLEKTFMATEERSTALSHDKEKAIERERAIKGHLDELKIELHRARGEVEVLDRKLQQVEESRRELERTRAEQEARLVEAEEQHRAELTRLREEQTQTEQALIAELEELKRRSAEELADLTLHLLAEQERAHREHEQVLKASQGDLQAELERERQSHREALESKDSTHAAELQSLRQRLEEEHREEAQRRSRELGEAETRRLVDLEAAEQRRLAECRELKEDYLAKLGALERLNVQQKSESAERHREELEQSSARARRAEADLEAHVAELEETRERLQALQRERDRLAAEQTERENQFGQLRDKTAELESRSAEYEDQILRAFQKLRSDDKLIERAKRALAISLQVLDERAGVPVSTTPGPGPSTPGPSPASPAVASLGTPQPTGEDPGAGS